MAQGWYSSEGACGDCGECGALWKSCGNCGGMTALVVVLVSLYRVSALCAVRGGVFVGLGASAVIFTVIVCCSWIS